MLIPRYVKISSMYRLLDVLFSFFGLILLLPLLLVLSILIKLDTRGPVFYRQKRVGRGNVDFSLYKFRSMRVDSDKLGLITVGSRDSRITRIGFYIRRYKLDELPQLINVLIGDMSLVGPRPEVRKYVCYYSDQQMQILSVRPGITDMSSFKYRNENELLACCDNPEDFYIKHIMPDKIDLNMTYINNKSIVLYFKIIYKTFFDVFFKCNHEL